MEFGEVGFRDVEAHDVDLDAEEGDFSDAEAEELVFFFCCGGGAGAVGEGTGCC